MAGKASRIIEVVNKLQTTRQLIHEVATMIANNPLSTGKVVSWVAHVDRAVKSIRTLLK